jgi:C1A family cysteine protease
LNLKRNCIALVIVASGGILAPPLFAQTLPTSIDWREKGFVTPVKNQGQCGSSWAFAATAAIEGARKLKTGHLITVSEQQLIDCSGSEGNQGCQGGTAHGAFLWVLKHGIAAESSYPYTARDGSCKPATAVTRLSGLQQVGVDMTSLMTAVSRQPVAVLLSNALALSPAFEFHHSGVIACATPQPTTTGHVWVTIVGYGVDPTSGHDYYLVKNSVGTNWGEGGYARITRSASCHDIIDAWVPFAQ